MNKILREAIVTDASGAFPASVRLVLTEPDRREHHSMDYVEYSLSLDLQRLNLNSRIRVPVVGHGFNPHYTDHKPDFLPGDEEAHAIHHLAHEIGHSVGAGVLNLLRRGRAFHL